ncbi:hypothetical protein GGTG_04669 [Gaeumannomyces tritici R3-111a-1]|uniref:Uncharacterized protein n=1 Tax=Gaeumannomyces tritici (strain R3-111a-1) TaxID=644352 RepID=J3NTR9_GAET3|nr:hypothetical protein GGTG_04669 [Gaeumannomyces tritici R3-111a-1]EJT79584.1 hypothetical protein GGTG_04669 [Gaeumannomyces tritici R3-111a-1]
MTYVGRVGNHFKEKQDPLASMLLDAMSLRASIEGHGDDEDKGDGRQGEDDTEATTIRPEGRYQDARPPRIIVDGGTGGMTADPRMDDKPFRDPITPASPENSQVTASGLNADMNFKLGQPFKPFEQLMGVLPDPSKKIVPTRRLLDAMATKNDFFADDEKARNGFGVAFNLDFLYGLTDGAFLNKSALAGFPSFATLLYLAILGFHSVDVFQQESRNESMVVTLSGTEAKAAVTSAKMKLGQRCHVGYPFLQEAMVVRVSDELFDYVLDAKWEYLGRSATKRENSSRKGEPRRPL